jgi:LPS export ABC transporter protein LptC
VLKKNKEYSKILGIAAIYFIAAIFLSSCSDGSNEKVPEINRTDWPSLKSENIVTVISDSGVVRYKISAPVYEVFDKVNEPYWNFSKGLTLIRLTNNKAFDSELKCNYAKYFIKDELWQLEDSVFAKNFKGETFETELLFWDQKTEKIYSDKMVRITKAEEQIICYGFESNQNFTIYSFKKVQAIFPLNVE